MSKRSRDASEDISSGSEAGEQQETSSKYAHVEPPTSQCKKSESAIRCSLPPHARPYSFSTYHDFDNHIRKVHTNRCATCNKNFPSNHYLNLHIAEVHDSLAEAKRARGDKTFGCFVEGCDKLFYTPQKRRLHLIDKHEFPQNYNFFVTKDGIDKRHSLLVPGRATRHRSAKDGSEALPSEVADEASAAGDEGADGVSGEGDAASSIASGEAESALTPSTSASDTDMESLTKTMSSLRFVPPSVRFGRGRGRGFAKR